MIDRNSYEPLYVQVKKDIVAQMESGGLKIGDKLLSESEMLHHYGVGRVTIRTALAELVAEGCLRKEHGLGTFVVGLPKKSKRLNIDVLLDAGDTYFVPSYMLKGISPVLEQNNCNLLMHDTKHDSRRILELLRNILERGTDGVILAPLSKDYQSPELEKVIGQYQRAEIPLVVVLGTIPYCGCVNLSVDDAYGTEVATRYLLECGHRNILGLMYEKDRDPDRRLWGFRRAVSGIADAVTYEITSADWEEQVLTLARKKAITAIQCYNDRVAVEAMRLLVEHGFRIPGDISLVGFDDSEIAQNSIPRLTTMTHPKDQLGHSAAEMILRRIRNPEEPMEDVTYRPGLVIRQSVQDLTKKQE